MLSAYVVCVPVPAVHRSSRQLVPIGYCQKQNGAQLTLAGLADADALKWAVQYDHGAPLTTEEYTQQQGRDHAPPRRPA